MRHCELSRTMHRLHLTSGSERSLKQRAKYLTISDNAICALNVLGSE